MGGAESPRVAESRRESPKWSGRALRQRRAALSHRHTPQTGPRREGGQGSRRDAESSGALGPVRHACVGEVVGEVHLAEHLAHVGPEAAEQEQPDGQSRGGCVIAVPLSRERLFGTAAAALGTAAVARPATRRYRLLVERGAVSQHSARAVPSRKAAVPPHSSTSISAACKEGSEKVPTGLGRALPRASLAACRRAASTGARTATSSHRPTHTA